MFYIVTVRLGGEIVSRERVSGMDKVWEIEDYYRQYPEYEVDDVPDTRGYIAFNHPNLSLPH